MPNWPRRLARGKAQSGCAGKLRCAGGAQRKAANTNPVYSRSYMRPFFNPYTRRWATLYYPSQFLGYDNGMRSVREGTLTVTMTDAKTDKMVWQGWTTDEVNSKNLTARKFRQA
jgi:hypothetical protein